jgi:4-cresol dehydrogenase (hydroxylating)
MARSHSVIAFLGRCRDLLGASAVFDGERVVPYGDNCIALHRDVAGVVRPSTTDEVAGVVRLAAEHEVPLYPISTGRNWGYGTALPVRSGSMILDLSGMDRIVDFDPESGLLTVEPGVTQRQLNVFLCEHDYPFLIPVTGSGPDCSLLGNALERGYGITPYADHFAAATSLEVVLPDGSLYRALLDELGGKTVNQAFKWGLGPYVDGLFTQGNFGIVTRMTLALAPRPERVQAFFFSVKRDRDLELAVQYVRRMLREVGQVTGSVNLMNLHRVLSMAEPYPRDRLGPDGLIPGDVLQQMARRNQFTAWNGAGAMYGNKAVVAAARREIRKILRPVASRLMFLTPGLVAALNGGLRKLRMVQRFPLANTLATLEKSLRLLAGQPSEIALPLSYWRSGSRPENGRPMDPARDGCGLIWYSPLVPMRGDSVRSFVSTVERVCRSHGIEPLVTLTSLSDRCFGSTVPILFERSDAIAAKRAHACYEALFAAGKGQGFLPYRLGVQAMEDLRDSGAVPEISQQIKRTLDPEGIMAPGRYGLG